MSKKYVLNKKSNENFNTPDYVLKKTDKIKLKYKTLESEKNAKYIYHISDVHIKLFKDHDEYEEVFETLYEYLRSEFDNCGGEGIIVLTGDILHSKSDLSSNCVKLTSMFLDKLSDIMNLFIIMGNHDINMSNRDHLDGLSPIIDALDKDSIYYLPKSGVYNYGNISFVVSSVADGNNIIKIKDLNVANLQKYTIGLYHGITGKCLNDSNIVLPNNNPINNFKDYDYVLLGDVHRHQYMNEDKTIAYAGSLIGQNYGESMDEHGLIKWNIDDGTSEFVKITNRCGYVTLIVENGKYETVQLPEKARIKIKIMDDTDEDTIKEIINELKEKTDVQEIIQLRATPEIEHKENITPSDDTMITDTNDLIKHWYEEKYEETKKEYYNLDSSTLKKICKLNEYYGNMMDDTNVQLKINKCVNWSLKRLIFSNMFSYGTNNIIDFTGDNNIYGIIADNGSGKSSIVDILLFSLFNQYSRAANKTKGVVRDIINTNKKEISCQVEFEIGTDRYYVYRKGRIAINNKMSETVEFFKIDNSGKKEILGNGTRAETNKLICSYIGTYDNFVSSFVSTQNNNDNFIDLVQKERRKFISSLLQIEILEKMHDISNKDKLEVGAELKCAKSNYEQENKNEQDKEYKELKIKRDELDKKIKIKTDELHQFQKTKKELSKNYDNDDSEYCGLSNVKLNKILNEKQQKLIELNKDIVDTKKLIEEIKKIKNIDKLEIQKKTLIKKKEAIIIKKAKIKFIDLDTVINNNKKQHEYSTKNLDDYVDKINDIFVVNKWLFDNKNIYYEYNKLTQYIENNKNIEFEYKQMCIQRKNDMQTLKMLSKHQYDPDCEYCTNNDFVKDALKIKNNVSKLNKKYKTISNKYNEYNKIKHEICMLKNIHDEYCIKREEKVNLEYDINQFVHYVPEKDEMLEYLKHGDSQIIIKQCDSEIKHYDSLIEEIEKLIVKAATLEGKQDKLSKLMGQIKIINDEIGDVQLHLNTADGDNKLDIVMDKIKNINDVLEKLNTTLNGIIRRIDILENNLDKLHTQKLQIDALQNKYDVFKYYVDAMALKNIPNMLIMKYIPNFKNKVNNILGMMCKFTIDMTCDDTNIEIFIIKKMPNGTTHKHNAQTACGFEKSAINVAIRIAISKSSSLSKSNVFIMDESLTTFDNTNKNNVAVLFRYLASQFDNVIVISHFNEIKTCVTKTIELFKKKGESCVNNTKYKNVKELLIKNI